MNRSKKRKNRLFPMLITVMVLTAVLTPAAYADTDGTEPKITQQPDQLVLQLGTRWAGVEFELRTDAGIFPVPVVVDEYGVLTMDLGGSTTYTLSCIHSTAPIPDSEPEQTAPPPPAISDPVPEAPVSPQKEGKARRPSDSSSHLSGRPGRRGRSNRHAPYHKEAPGIRL